MMFISGKEKLSGRDEIRYIAHLLSYPFNLVIYKGRERLDDWMIDCDKELDCFRFDAKRYTITYDKYLNRIVYKIIEEYY